MKRFSLALLALVVQSGTVPLAAQSLLYRGPVTGGKG